MPYSELKRTVLEIAEHDVAGGPKLGVLDDGIVVVALDNPENRNALSLESIASLHRLLSVLEKPGAAQGLVLHGAGHDIFCAGFSLKSLQGMSRLEISANPASRLCDRIAALPIPTALHASGHVIGAGVQLAMSFDYRVGTPGTYVQVPALKLGVFYGQSALLRMKEELGAGRTRRIILSGRKIFADELLAAGFFDELRTKEEGLEAAIENVRHCARASQTAYAETKAFLRAAGFSAPPPEISTGAEQRCLESSYFEEALRKLKRGE